MVWECNWRNCAACCTRSYQISQVCICWCVPPLLIILCCSKQLGDDFKDHVTHVKLRGSSVQSCRDGGGACILLLSTVGIATLLVHRMQESNISRQVSCALVPSSALTMCVISCYQSSVRPGASLGVTRYGAAQVLQRGSMVVTSCPNMWTACHLLWFPSRPLPLHALCPVMMQLCNAHIHSAPIPTALMMGKWWAVIRAKICIHVAGPPAGG